MLTKSYVLSAKTYAHNKKNLYCILASRQLLDMIGEKDLLSHLSLNLTNVGIRAVLQQQSYNPAVNYLRLRVSHRNCDGCVTSVKQQI